MSDLQEYLTENYLTADQLAAVCIISTSELATLVAEKLVPQASYSVLGDGVFISQAFGEFPQQNATAGDYFHPGNAKWIALAIEVKRERGAKRAHEKLKQQFRENFASALSDLDRSTFRLPDSFTDTGQTISEGLDSRTASAWDSFLAGIFSLCVADPSSERSIAEKEVLQEALSKLTGGRASSDCSPEGKRRVLDLVDQYATKSMPFSPPEYAQSSRKRLVEDLRIEYLA
jgi:hypothetical protein